MDRPAYPYLPDGKDFLFVGPENEYMAIALQGNAETLSKHPHVNHPTCAVIVSSGEVVSVANNGAVHQSFCPRIAIQFPSGQGYEFCPNHCHSDNHAETQAVKAAQKKGKIDLSGADLYLAGHWWACEPCWRSMLGANISRVFLEEGAFEKFNDDARRSPSSKSGHFEKEMTFCVLGNEKDNFCAALGRVGARCVSEGEACDAYILLFGANAAPQGVQVYDYRSISDWRLAITQLSIDLENE